MPDNYNRLRPDFEADMQLPEWHQFAEQSGQPLQVSPFVDALKKRMKPSGDGGLGSAAGGMMKGGSGGGMESL